MGAPVGPTGCEGSSDEKRGPWSAGASAAYFVAKLRFDGEENYQLSQSAVAASLGYQANSDLSFRLGLGAIIDGELQGEAQRHDVEPGWVGSISVANRWFGGDGGPFLTTTLSLAHSRSSTRSLETQTENQPVDLSAWDLRFGTLLGITLWERFSPYLAARIFGGPVSWTRGDESATGSDRNHYAVGGGAVASLPAGIALQVDGSFLGERSISGAATISF